MGRVSDMVSMKVQLGEQARTSYHTSAPRVRSSERWRLTVPNITFVTIIVTIRSQEEFNSVQAPPNVACHRSDPLPLELNLFYSALVMSAPRKRKERTSDSQTFDSVQGNYTIFILSVCHTFRLPLWETTPRSPHTPQKILFSESKLNSITARTPKALMLLSLPSFTNSRRCPNVSSFYVPIRASPC